MIARTKAAFAGRTGPPLLQPYHDILKLLRKGSVFSTTSTWVLRAGPVVGVAAGLAAALIVPFGEGPAPVSFEGDLVLFVYLLALSRFFLAAAALDTGSAFGGMGAAREVSFACLAEPALFLGLVALAKMSGALSLSPMLRSPWSSGWVTTAAPLLLVVASFFVVLLAESSRVPFDDPSTHLELTMIHEAMVLDHSGPLFGLVLWGASLKLFVLGALLLRLLLPFSAGGAFSGALSFVAGMLLLAIAIGVVESAVARLRLVRVPILLVTASLLSAFGLVLQLR